MPLTGVRVRPQVFRIRSLCLLKRGLLIWLVGQEVLILKSVNRAPLQALDLTT